MRVLGPFPSLEDPATLVWLRAFPEGASRDQLKRAFYEGPEWTGELEPLLMPLLEDYAAVLVEVLRRALGPLARRMSAPPVVVVRLGSVELEPSQPEIYDRPIGLRGLYQDPISRAEHYLVPYPAGLRDDHHRHSAAHTIIVLEGAMELDGRILPPGSYAHHPPGTSMHHVPAPGQHCLFVIIFHGPFDVIPITGRAPDAP